MTTHLIGIYKLDGVEYEVYCEREIVSGDFVRYYIYSADGAQKAVSYEDFCTKY